MKRNSLVIFATVTALLTVDVHSTLGTSPSGGNPSTPQNPIYISQATVQNSPSAPVQSKSKQGSGSSVPLVLGVLVLLAIGAGAWILRSRTASQSTQTEDPQTIVSDRATISVIPEQASVEPEKIVAPEKTHEPLEEVVPAQVPEVFEETIPDQEGQDLQQPVVLTQDSSDDLQQKLELLQSTIAAAKQKFQTLSQKLEQEITHQIQVLPESILNQPDPELLSKQQQALEKLEALQAVFLDLELTADGYFKMGNVLFNTQQYDDAIVHYDKAINLNPDSAFAWFNTACIYALQGDAPRSTRYLKQSIDLNPDCLEMAKKHPEFDGMRENVSFQEILKT